MDFQREALFFLEQMTRPVEMESRIDVYRLLKPELFSAIHLHQEIHYILNTFEELSHLGRECQIVQFENPSMKNPADFEQWAIISDEVVYTLHDMYSLDLFEHIFQYPLQGSQEKFFNIAKKIEGRTASFPKKYDSDTEIWACFQDPIDEGKTHSSVFVPSTWQKRVMAELTADVNSFLDSPLSQTPTHFQVIKPLSGFQGLHSMEEAIYSLPPFFASIPNSNRVSIFDTEFYEQIQAIQPLLRATPNDNTVQFLLWPRKTNKGFSNFHVEINNQEDLKLLKSVLLHIHQQDRFSKHYLAVNYANTDGTQEQAILSLNSIRHSFLLEELKHSSPEQVESYVLTGEMPESILNKDTQDYPYVYRTQIAEADRLILNFILECRLKEQMVHAKSTLQSSPNPGRF